MLEPLAQGAVATRRRLGSACCFCLLSMCQPRLASSALKAVGNPEIRRELPSIQVVRSIGSESSAGRGRKEGDSHQVQRATAVAVYGRGQG